MKLPFFSVITICFNSSESIDECLTSLYSQEFKDYEHIIQDGDSKDSTLEIIKTFDNKKTYIVSKKDNGLYDALNKAIKRCRGEYILLLHSDDTLYEKNTLKNLYEFICKKNHPEVIITGVEIIGKNEKVKRRWMPSLPTKFKINTGWMAPHTGIIIKGDIAKKSAPYDTSLKISADYDFEISLFRKYQSDTFLAKLFLTKMKEGGRSNSGIKTKLNKTKEDMIVMKRNKINPLIGIIIKNIRKVNQLLHI
tara:strand:- start:491 stop:1243 length:753 start_codon:yes stop_codon:yes gene_type:complete